MFNKFFDNKLFLSLDTEAGAQKDGHWMYMNNEWIINLCSDMIECPQYSNQKISSYLKDFYQFLTGTQFGTNHEAFADCSASLISDYYETIRELRSYKADAVLIGETLMRSDSITDSLNALRAGI